MVELDSFSPRCTFKELFLVMKKMEFHDALLVG
jgi:hypothetical protein